MKANKDLKRQKEHANYVRFKDEKRERKAKENNALFFDNKKADSIIEEKHIGTDGDSFHAIKGLSDSIESKTNIYTDKIELAANGSISERVNIIMKTLHKKINYEQK